MFVDVSFRGPRQTSWSYRFRGKKEIEIHRKECNQKNTTARDSHNQRLPGQHLDNSVANSVQKVPGSWGECWQTSTSPPTRPTRPSTQCLLMHPFVVPDLVEV